MPLRRLAVAAFFLALSAPLPAPAQPHSPAPNTLTDAEKKAGWILLFDGHSLDAWRGYKKPDATDSRWKAEDGSLALPPDNGKDTHGQRDIITKDTFEQFELVVDWKIAPGGNSGIKYFVLEDRDSAIGHEYQVIDDERHPDAKVGPHRQTAAFYDVLQANDRPLKPAGEWNTTRIIVRGQTVEHWLNGKKVLQYELNSPALNAAIEKSKFKGMESFGKRQNAHILLQDHGNQVWFRNIKIRRLA
jgi:3-keto-disaccharide hydrolase